MSTSPLTFRLARPDEGPAVAAFLDAHWGEKHPLVHLPDFFDFYYRPFGPDGPLQFAFAEQDGAPVAIVGYIRANALETPDIWVSIWCAVKGHNGSGLELMAALPGLTNARVMACNNIRPRTMAFYTFLGYTAERLPHYYRLADKASYAVARVARRDILPAGGSAVLHLLPDEDALRKCGYTPDPARRPYKDLWYLARRYFHYPRQRYDVWAVEECGAVQALLATRCIPVNGTCVLRRGIRRLLLLGHSRADDGRSGLLRPHGGRPQHYPQLSDAAALRKYGILFLHQRTRCFHDVQGRRGPGQAQYQGGMTPRPVPPFHCNAMPGRCVKTSAGFLCVLPKIITTPFFLLPFTLICYIG